MSYDLGDTATPSIEIRDTTGVLAAGGAVSAVITLPDGVTTTSPTITNPSTGLYRATYVTTTAGRHIIRWTVTGANAGTHVDVFDVDDVARASVVSLPDVKRYLRNAAPDPSRDDELRAVLEAATALCEDWTGRTYRLTQYTETYDGVAGGISLRHMPIQAVTAVTQNGSAITQYFVTHAGILYRGTQIYPIHWWPGVDNVTVTYAAGSGTISPRVTEAVLVTVEHLWSARRGGSNLPRQSGANDDYAGSAPWALPRRAQELLAGDDGPSF